MDDTSRPASPEQNLWDSILNSVSTRRSIPSGNVLILGEPSTGKTTLANALLQRASTDSRNETGERFGKNDFALGYQWSNVKEEGEEGVPSVTLGASPSERRTYTATRFGLQMLSHDSRCIRFLRQTPHTCRWCPISFPRRLLYLRLLW